MRKIFILFVTLGCTICVHAQSVEIAATTAMNNVYQFYEYSDPVDGLGVGLSSIHVDINNNIYVQNLHDYNWYKFGDQDKCFAPIPQFDSGNPVSLNTTNASFFGIANCRFGQKDFDLMISTNGITQRYEIHNFNFAVDNCYFTGNTLFVEHTYTHSLASIEFLSDGSYKVRDASETETWLKDGKGEELGWSQEIYKGQVLTNYFGDNDLSHIKDSYKIAVLDSNVTEDVKDGYEKLWSSNYGNFAKDGKGLIYFRRMKTDNGRYRSNQPSKNIVFEIAILDPWTKQVRYYEDYGPNVFNPPRDADEYIIGSYSWTVAPDGNIYFTDADVEKGEYQIKRVINRWWDDMGINDRIIGQMNTNHIPLLTAMNGSQNNGYCFENDFVWVTEQNTDKTWSKIKKIDGREGWIETKYIDINTMVPVTNASLGITIDQSPATTAAVPTAKILKAADNLRLRKTELTSSEVITTMLKGTPVKIVATGRKETIDGITGNWVQVEVQSGGKDRNGSPIPAGTTGWCFGGYLE